MPTTDTPPAAPTAEGLRAALAVIDRHAGAIKTGLSYWPPSGEVAAALAVARAAVARAEAYDDDAAHDADAAVDALDAAVAGLVALAKGGA